MRPTQGPLKMSRHASSMRPSQTCGPPFQVHCWETQDRGTSAAAARGTAVISLMREMVLTSLVS